VRFRQRLSVIATVLVPAILLSATAGHSNGTTDVKTLVESNTAFALDLYQLLKTDKDNLFFSPYSISTALAMTYAGAKANTARQMFQVLHFTLRQKQLHLTFGDLEARLNALRKKEDIELRVANALWTQKDYQFLQQFFDVVKQNYGAELSYADFKTAHESARREINAWVERQTNDKIKDLIRPGVLNALTRLVLANAIYFKGFWISQFDESATQNDKFYLAPDTAVDVPMMRQEHKFNYMEDDNLQVLELPYVGDHLSMIVLLPKRVEGLTAVEGSLTTEALSALLDRLRKRTVMVYLPRFKLTSQFSLENTLASLGMPDSFKPGIADFSGMDGTRMLYISAVVHKAFVDVNEEGTEAAAATGVVVRVTSAPAAPTVFRADHPFTFLIRDNRSGSILFLGRVVDPTK